MRLRRLNNAIHRDLGYFLVGTTMLYAVSGFALNHVADWNPSFVIDRREVQTPIAEQAKSVTREWVLEVLRPLGEENHYRSHDFPTASKLKIYLDEGSLLVDLKNGRGVYETVRRRAVFYEINCLHLSPRHGWLAFSDVFAVSLIVVALTGLFMVKGTRGITRRGAVLAAAGLLVPLLFIISIK